jgi:hypothetical protein
MRFHVLTAASMKMAVFWVVAPCSLMMEAASASETSVNFYQTIRRNNPEESHFHSVVKLAYNLESTIKEYSNPFPNSQAFCYKITTLF